MTPPLRNAQARLQPRHPRPRTAGADSGCPPRVATRPRRLQNCRATANTTSPRPVTSSRSTSGSRWRNAPEAKKSISSAARNSAAPTPRETPVIVDSQQSETARALVCDSRCHQRLAAPRKVGPSSADLPKDSLHLRALSEREHLIERECHLNAISFVSTKPLLAHRHEEATGVIAGPA